MQFTDKNIASILRVATFFIFFGRAYQFVFFDAPLRVLLWDQSIMTPFVKFFGGQEWNVYATNPQVDQLINWIQFSIGGIFVLAAISSILVSVKRMYLKWFIYLAIPFLVLLFLLQFKDRFYQMANFFEHAIQMFTPLVFIYFIGGHVRLGRIIQFSRILIAATFVSHGLYALGYYPQPGNFIDLVIGTFGWSESFARLFIKVAGWMDLVVVSAMFYKPLSNYAIWYMVGWGLLTAFARITAGVHIDFFFQSIHQSVYLSLFRLCHGLLPLALIGMNYLYNVRGETVSIQLKLDG